MAEVCWVAGLYCLEEAMDTSAVERDPLYKALIAERPAWDRACRETLGSKAPPIEPNVKAIAFKEVDSYAKLEARNPLSGIGGI